MLHRTHNPGELIVLLTLAAIAAGTAVFIYLLEGFPH